MVFVIRDREALKVLTDPLRAQMFEALAQEQLSPRQLGERLGVAASKLYYHLNMMEKHGFIAVAETRMVANLVEKLYRAAAMTLSVDPALLTFSTPEHQENLFTVTESTLAATREDLMRSFQARAYELAQGATPQPRKMIITRDVRRLPEERIDEFTERLEALITEFAASDTTQATDQAYALTVAFYPSFHYSETADQGGATPPAATEGGQ
ncbi:MAG TPA: helix-turn-helix domain-containing protein [Herpetosiphonaceae bacterium]